MTHKHRQVAMIVVRYGGAVAMVAIALAITLYIRPLLGESISPLFFAAVMLSAWFGGPGPGLTATALAAGASTYYFRNPPGSSLVGWDDLIRLIVFLMVALLISALTSLRKHAEAELRKSHSELERRVEVRTAELKSSNDRLRESEERFRLLVEGVADYAILMLDMAGHMVSWNTGAERIMGYSHAEILGRHVSCFFPEGGAGGGALDQAAGQGRQEEEGWRIRKDGSRFWANVITTTLRDEAGKPRGFAQITRDVTELRGLERQVLEISEAEQRRIGHDLHDGLGQELTGLAFLSQNLARNLASQSLPESAAAERIAGLINRTIEQARELARGFSPVEIGPEGLPAALAALTRRVRELSPFSCTLACARDVLVHHDATALHLYRIAQEAVNNAVRHSKGNHIRVALERMGNDIRLTVEDDGVGVPSGVRGNGMGINLMLYRARTIGAMLEVRRGITGGAIVSCICPGAGIFGASHGNSAVADHPAPVPNPAA